MGEEGGGKERPLPFREHTRNLSALSLSSAATPLVSEMWILYMAYWEFASHGRGLVPSIALVLHCTMGGEPIARDESEWNTPPLPFPHHVFSEEVAPPPPPLLECNVCVNYQKNRMGKLVFSFCR